MRSFGIAVALIGLVFCQVPNRVLSQSGASLLEGMVQDDTNAVIQDCDVTLFNNGTGATLMTRTNEDGVYVFPSV